MLGALIFIFGVSGLAWMISCSVQDRPADDAIPGIVWFSIAIGLLMSIPLGWR